MVWERRALVESRPRAKVLSIRHVYALSHEGGRAFEYLGFLQTHAHCERQSLRLQPAVLYRVQQLHKCWLGCAGNPHPPIMQNMLEQISVCSVRDRLEEIAAPD